MHYPGDAGTPTANLLTVKLLLNSIISTPNAKFTTMDIKDFYLNTPMARYEYMQLRISDMPEDVIAYYKLTDIATHNGYIYCKIQKGMYGLPQAGIIAQQLLKKRLKVLATVRAQSPQACGSMTPTPSASPSLSTILESNMWEKRMRNTC